MSQTGGRVRGALERWYRGEGPVTEGLLCGLLALTYAFGFCALLIWLHAPLTEPREWQVFVLAWLLLPPLSLGAVLVPLSRGAGDPEAYLGRLALGQAWVVVLAAGLLRAAAQPEPALPPPTLRAVASVAPSLLAAGALLLPVSRVAARARPRPAAVLVLLALAIALLALPDPPTPTRIGLVAAGALGLLVAREALARLLFGWSAGRWIHFVDLAVLGVAAALVFDPHLHFDIGHHNWFLGPAHQILLGSTMLADVACSYGVLSIYVLAGLLAASPVPISYLSLASIVLGLVIAQYATFYALLRHLRVSWAHAGGALGAVFVANFIGLDGAVSAYPSLGPMRFGLPYLLLIGVALRGRRPEWTRSTWICESLVVAAASLWSLETLVFALPTYLAILLLEALLAARDAPLASRRWLATTGLRLGATACAIIATHAAFAGLVQARVGAWPDWPSYFALVGVYTPAGRGILLHPVPALGPWVALMFVYAASALACVFATPRARGHGSRAALVLVFGATALGVAQFSVYVGMSSPYRLASVVMPAIFVGAYWVDRLARSSTVGRATGRATAFAAYLAAGLIVLHFEVQLRDWIAHDSPSSLGSGRIGRKSFGCADFPSCLWSPPAVAPMTHDAELLIEKYLEPGQNVAVILDNHSTTEVLLRSGRRNPVPTNAPLQDGLARRNADRIAKAPHRLAVGDILLWRTEVEAKSPRHTLERGGKELQIRLLRRACDEFECRELERYHGIVVQRLEARKHDGES